MKKLSKIILIISGLSFVAANANVGSVNDAARYPAPVQNTALKLGDVKYYPLARSDSRKGLSMLMPNALEKAEADAIKRRASRTKRRLTSAIGAQMEVTGPR